MATNKDSLNLDILKKKYRVLQNKYSLPDFNDLNEAFDIEEIEVESDFILRKIRQIISERIVSYLRFIEVVLNPSNAPIFFFKLIKKITEEDKEILSEIYDSLNRYEIEVLILDIDYFEENEAKFIKNVFESFKADIRNKLLKIIKKMASNGADIKKTNNGGYVG